MEASLTAVNNAMDTVRSEPKPPPYQVVGATVVQGVDGLAERVDGLFVVQVLVGTEEHGYRTFVLNGGVGIL